MPRDNLESMGYPAEDYGFGGDWNSQLLANLGLTMAPTYNSGVDWANSLEWGGGKTFRLPTEFELARGSFSDAGKGAENDFVPNAQNAQLLRTLGFGGQALSGDAWTNEARQWLYDNGYQLGVGHQPGTSEGGRAEYWGLLGPDGRFVQGQSDPTMTMSDTLMDQVGMLAMVAAPFASAISSSMAAAGGAAGAAGGAGGVGSLAAADSGLSALGSAWSPQALGLTNAIAPGITSAELAALSQALPEIGSSGLGAASSGLTSLASSMSPQALGLTGGIVPGITSTELAALSQALPGAVTPAVSGAGAALTSAEKAAMYGAEGYGPGMTGAQTAVYDNLLNATGSKWLADMAANSAIGSSIINGAQSVADLAGGAKTVADMVGGGQNLAGLIGAVGGAVSGGGNTTATTQSQIDPRMAQYLYGSGYGDTNSMLGAAKQLWQDNRGGINPTMQQGLDIQRAALQDPAYGQAFTQMRSLGTGLMGQPVAGNPFTAPQGPAAQAGGPGGLLGGSPSGRALSLISRGRGLLG